MHRCDASRPQPQRTARAGADGTLGPSQSHELPAMGRIADAENEIAGAVSERLDNALRGGASVANIVLSPICGYTLSHLVDVYVAGHIVQRFSRDDLGFSSSQEAKA